MRFAIIILTALLVSMPTLSHASSLTVSAKHDVLVVQTPSAKRQLVRTLFAEDPLVVDVVLNVYVLDELPSSRRHYDDLRTLRENSWLSALEFELSTTDGRHVTLPSPTILSKNVRVRGPAAPRSVDRDTRVEMTTYRSGLSFGPIPPGDYELNATIRGLESKFTFSVRTGSEPEFRDDYLRLKALRTADYATFRQLQLERLERNPKRLDALYDLIDRSLVKGSLPETESYFDHAIAVADRGLQQSSDPATKAKIESGIAQLRAAKAALPSYFKNRDVWVMTRDVRDGHYAIRERRSGAVLQDFGRSRQ